MNTLDSLAAEASGTILIDNYTSHGVMIYDGSTLWFVTDLYSGSDGKVYFNRQIKLCTDPSLPSDEKFRAIFVNRNGSRVALLSEHSVFVIEIPYDCWCRQSVTRNPSMDHLQSTYVCRSQPVGSHTRSTSSAIDILKIRWYWKGRHESGHHPYNRLAVLSGGNVVRIYDTDINCTIPTVVIDFKSLLGLSESNFGTSFGIHNYIASFDFGPSYVHVGNEDGTETSRKTLFAIDNDCGDIYIVVYSDSEVIEMQGPLALTGTVTDDCGPSGAFDILYVEYDGKTSLPVFSLISSKGCITHFLAITFDQETFDGQHIEFILVPYDNILLPFKPLPDISYCLQNDRVQSGQYFVLCGANVFSIDINPWAHLLSNMQLADGSHGKGTNDLPDSRIHHLFVILGSTEAKGLADAITFATSACITNDKYLVSVEFNGAYDEKDLIYIATTSSKQMLHKFARRDAMWLCKRAIFRQNGMSVEGKNRDYLLEECLKILQSHTAIPSFKINNSMAEAEAIAVADGVVEALIGNMKVTQAAFKKIHNIVTDDIKSLETINNEKSTCTERLLRILSTYVDLKNRIYKIRRAIAQLKKRSDELGLGLVPKIFPLTEPEKAVKDKLEKLQIEVDGITRQLPYLANEVAIKRRNRFGPLRSFCASMSAQKFMLSKNTNDINEMVSWTKQITKKIDSIQANTITEEALCHLPKLRSQCE